MPRRSRNLQNQKIKHAQNKRRARYHARKRMEEKKSEYFSKFYAYIIPVMLGFPQQKQKELEHIEKGKTFHFLPVVVVKIIMVYIEDLHLKDDHYMNRTIHFKEYVNMDIKSYKQYGVLRPSDLRFMTRFFGYKRPLKHSEKPPLCKVKIIDS